MASRATAEVILVIKDEASKKLVQASKNASQATKGFQEAAATAGRVGALAFTAAATAAVSASASIIALTADVAAVRNEISDMGARTGVTNRTLAGLKLAAERSGEDLSSLNEVLNPLVAKLGQVRQGSAGAEESFASFGIQIRDANGELLSNDDVLKNVAAGLQGIKNPSERASAAVAILGESGGKLNQILGDASLETFVDQAERFGTDVGPEASASAAAWQASMADLSLVLSGAASDLSDFFNITGKLDNFVLGFVFVKEVATEAFASIGGQIIALGKAMEKVFAGDLVAAAKIADKAMLDFGDTEDEVLDRIMRKAENSTKAFAQNRKALREGGGTASTGGAGVGGAGRRNVNAAKSATDKAEEAALKAAEKAAADQLKLAQENYATFNQLVEDGFNAQLAAANAADEAATAQAAENFALFNKLVEEGLDRQFEESVKAAEEAANAPTRMQQSAEGITNVISVMEGGLTSILAAMGPAGAIASSIIGLLSNLDGFVQGLIDSIDDMIVGLVESLPTVIFELIPQLVQMIVLELPLAIAEAIDTVLKRLFKVFMPKESKKAENLEARRAKQSAKLADKFGTTESFRDRGFFVRLLGNMFANEEPNSGTEGFASGGFISSSGMAKVHRGERIVPQNGVVPSSGMGGMGSSTNVNLTIHVTGLLDPAGADRLVEQLNRYIGPRGFGIASVS